MLIVLAARVFAGVTLAAIAGGFLLEHSLAGWSRRSARVVKKGGRRGWTEAVWVVGTLTASFWSIGVLLEPA